MSGDNKTRIAKLREQAEASNLSGPAKDDELVLAIEPIVTRLEKLLDAGEVQTGKQEAHFEIWGKKIEQATQLLRESANGSKTALESSVQSGIVNFQQEIQRTSEQAQRAVKSFRFDFSMLLMVTAALVGMGLGIYLTHWRLASINERVEKLEAKIDNLTEIVERLNEQLERAEPQDKEQKKKPVGNGKK